MMTNALVFLIVLLFVYVITLKKQKSKLESKLDLVIGEFLSGKRQVHMLESRVDKYTKQSVDLIVSLNKALSKNAEMKRYTEQLELDYLILSSNLVDLTHDVD